jgi:hypothetical protein
MATLDTTKFEKLYDTYSAMLYGMAVEISPSIMQAEKILICTFKKAHQQNIADQKYPLHCLSLIKLLLQTAHQQINNNKGKINFKLNRFKDYPVLHSLLCEQAATENYDEENIGNREGAGKKLRAELLLLRYINTAQTPPTEQQNTIALGL